MSITFTITDNADGTGGIATISGSAVGSTNRVYSAPWSGMMGALTETVENQITGDGTAAVAPGDGYYLWRLLNIASGVQTNYLYYQNLTDAAEQAVLDRVLDAVKTNILSLGLVDIADVRVLKRWVPWPNECLDSTPLIIVCPVGIENFPGVMTGTDDIGEPVLVVMFDKNTTQYPEAPMTRNLLWREKILSRFRFQHLPGVTEVINCVPDPQPIFRAEMLYAGNVYFSPLAFHFIGRTVRG